MPSRTDAPRRGRDAERESPKQAKHLARAEGMTASEGLLAHGLKSSSSLSDAIMAANPLLEAFGNARTVRNNNSSRFGKFTALLFSRLGKPQGARVNQYLIEASRVASVSSNERCFHIFYQLLAGATQAEAGNLGLASPEHFELLVGGGRVLTASRAGAAGDGTVLLFDLTEGVPTIS